MCWAMSLRRMRTHLHDNIRNQCCDNINGFRYPGVVEDMDGRIKMVQQDKSDVECDENEVKKYTAVYLPPISTGCLAIGGIGTLVR